MNTEEHHQAQVDQYPDGNWIGYDDFYREIHERLGEGLWPALPKLLKHSSHDVRCCGLILAGKKQPESSETMRMIAPFMRDPHLLVRLTAFQQLLQFAWVDRDVAKMAYDIYREEDTARDQLPQVMAIRLLLKSLINDLRVIKDLEFGESLVTQMVEETLQEYGRR